MNCIQAEENFSAHFEDNLDYQALKRFETHLTGCATCQKEYDRFCESIIASQNLPQIEPSPFFFPTLHHKLLGEKRETITFWERIGRLFKMPKWALSGASVLLLVAATVTFMFRDDILNHDSQSPIDPRPGISSQPQNSNSGQFIQNGIEFGLPSTDSSLPIHQNYTLKQVSYTTISTGGGL